MLDSSLLLVDLLLQRKKSLAEQLNFVFSYVDLDHCSYCEKNTPALERPVFNEFTLTI